MISESLLAACHVYEDGAVKSLENYLFENKHILKAEFFGLEKLHHFENCYAMYHDFTDHNMMPCKGFLGISLDEQGNLKESVIPKNKLVAIAILHHKK